MDNDALLLLAGIVSWKRNPGTIVGPFVVITGFDVIELRMRTSVAVPSPKSKVCLVIETNCLSVSYWESRKFFCEVC